MLSELTMIIVALSIWFGVGSIVSIVIGIIDKTASDNDIILGVVLWPFLLLVLLCGLVLFIVEQGRKVFNRD